MLLISVWIGLQIEFQQANNFQSQSSSFDINALQLFMLMYKNILSRSDFFPHSSLKIYYSAVSTTYFYSTYFPHRWIMALLDSSRLCHDYTAWKGLCQKTYTLSLRRIFWDKINWVNFHPPSVTVGRNHVMFKMFDGINFFRWRFCSEMPVLEMQSTLWLFDSSYWSRMR